MRPFNINRRGRRIPRRVGVCDEGFQALGNGFQGKRSMSRTDELVATAPRLCRGVLQGRNGTNPRHGKTMPWLPTSKAVRVENPRPPVSAGGKIMQVVETVVVTLPRHAGIL